jgi:dihydrofolate reductase
MQISIIVAVAKNGVIGVDGHVPWRLRDDMQRFKSTTMGHYLIVGRRTWESIGRPLIGRKMVVITRQADYRVPQGLQVRHSLEDALELAKASGETETFIGGGAAVYAEALPMASRMYYTQVQAEPAGDTYFPKWPREAWRSMGCDDYLAGESNQFSFRWCLFERKEMLNE